MKRKVCVLLYGFKMYSPCKGSEDLYDKIRKLSSIEKDDYADPSKLHTLPFPSIRWAQPDRFKIMNDNLFLYSGREIFLQIINLIESCLAAPSQNHKINIYGTMGYGKSHILAALACHLMSRDTPVHVVYIPDCKILAQNFVSCTRLAFLSACAHKSTKDRLWPQILRMYSMRDVIQFAHSTTLHFVYIVDQFDAVENDVTASNILEMTGSTFGSTVVRSASANSSSYKKIKNSRRERKVLVFGGMTPVSATLVLLNMMYFSIYRMKWLYGGRLGCLETNCLSPTRIETRT
jgi:hypothetical protein